MPDKVLLIFPFDLMSHYLRCIKLASHYKDHTILFAGSEKYNAYVTKAGYSVFDFKGFDPVKVMACAEKFDFSWLNKSDIERVFLSQVEIIKYYKPDMVIGDTSPTLKMATEIQNVKYVALMNGYMSKYYAETRALSRTHPGYPHLQKLPSNVANNIISLAERISFHIVHKPFKQLRRKYKLKRVAGYLNEMEGDENLICDEAELFPQKKLPEHYKIIGPLLHGNENDEAELLNSLNLKKPTVCICMGSSGNWKALSFLSKPLYTKINIITAGDTHHVLKGEHVFKKDFINLDRILPACSFLICHGGNGTIYNGLGHGLFMLCLTSNFEQEWNVQMLEKKGLGKCINTDPQNEIDNYLHTLLI